MLTSIPYPLKTDEVIITKIFFINCLPDEDVGIFNRCYEDITTNILDKTIYKNHYERIDCQSAAQFLNALDKIYEEVNRYRLCHAVRTENIMQAVLPFIQIEAHGSEEAIQMANGETVSGEIFYEKILKINIASENNTILLSNTCYSMSHFFSENGYQNIKKKGYPITTLAYAAIYSEQKIYPHDIEKHLYTLFEDLFLHHKTLSSMYIYANNVSMKIYHCQLEWEKISKNIINNLLPYKKHKERILTHFIKYRLTQPTNSIKVIRKFLKKSYYDSFKIAFEKAEKEFLIGKRSIYTLEDILKELDEESKK